MESTKNFGIPVCTWVFYNSENVPSGYVLTPTRPLHKRPVAKPHSILVAQFIYF
jgi:hypothetical protein